MMSVKAGGHCWLLDVAGSYHAHLQRLPVTSRWVNGLSVRYHRCWQGIRTLTDELRIVPTMAETAFRS